MLKPILCCFLACCFLAASAAFAGTSTVTYSKDVAPIFEKNCQQCHRPGEAAPMSLLSYEQARPWAKAIRNAVLLKKMPPWFADPKYGHFSNDRRLTDSDIQTIVAWADAGAPQGESIVRPAAQFVEGWSIGQPDVEFEIPKVEEIPATGILKYRYVSVATKFTEDKWVQFAEVRPGSRAHVHHVIAAVKPPGAASKQGDPTEYLVGFAPGSVPLRLENGQAKLIRAGSEIFFQIHYTTNGTPATDRTKVGLVFAKQPPRQRIFAIDPQNSNFTIPAGNPNFRVEADLEIGADVKLVSMLPHMHFRGKDFEVQVRYPDGRTETVLKVPKYDFGWQLVYYVAKPVTIPKGSRIHTIAHYDNSANNPSNPDPNKDVHWGDQTWDEMMGVPSDVAVDANIDVRTIVVAKKVETESANR